MKKIVFVIMTFIFGFTYQAQEASFTIDDSVINLGIGLGGTYYAGLGYSRVIPPVSISFEKGFKNEVLEKGTIGIGGYLGYTGAGWDYSDSFGTYSWDYSNILLGGRGSFHYPLIDNLDTYIGLMLGYDVASIKYSATGYYKDHPVERSSSGGLIWSTYLGGRYWISDNLGIMGELGYGISYLNLGIAYKL
jgi:hypothetical protein